MKKKKDGRVNNGGTRLGAGAKKIDPANKKKQVIISLKQSTIDKKGGEKAVKDICYKALK